MHTEINHYAASLQGDREAFGEIVRRNQNLVSAITYSITGNIQQSEDLAQETFITAWQRLGELRHVEKLPAWLCGIARNLANNYLRRTETERRARTGSTGTEATLENVAAPATDETGYDETDSEEQIALLWATLEQIPLQFREPLVMYYRQNQSVADIAAALELTEDTIRQRIARGRTFLKKEVERRVEQTLGRIKPGEHFTVAVLAAIPVFATAPEVFAATSAAGSASVAAKSSGGVPLFASVTAYVQFLTNAVFFPLAIFCGTVFGAWDGVRNSPTLRSRRFMLKATIFQTIMGMSFGTFFVIFARSYALFIPINGKAPLENFVLIFFLVYFIFIGLYCVISSFVINRRWRTIVEEDMVQPVDLDALEKSSLSLRNLRKFLRDLISIPFLAILPPLFFGMIMTEQYTHLRWWAFFEHLAEIIPMNAVGLFPFVTFFTLLIFYWVIEKKIKNENSLAVWPPKIPNILSVLTGEEKPKSGLRYRTNLWSDLLLIGVGLCVLQGIVCAGYFSHEFPSQIASGPAAIQGCYLAVFAVSFIAYVLFAMFFAGIPRKRYFGYIYFGLFIAVFNTLVLLIEPLLWQYFLGEPMPRWLLDSNGGRLFATLFWFPYFIMSGVAGLFAFRKRS